MDFKSFKNKPIFKIITNSYLLILTVFVIWMLLFDENSYLNHREFDNEIKDLRTWNNYYEKRLKEDKNMIKKLQDSLELERFAREKYLMKKDNEDIYIIEFDTLNK